MTLLKILSVLFFILVAGCNFKKDSVLSINPIQQRQQNDLDVPSLSADQITFKLIQSKVLARSCVGCHSAPQKEGGRGNAGGVNLETYLNVYKKRLQIRAAVINKTMPPEDYKDLALTLAQSDFLVKWIDGGAHEDIGSMPPPVDPPFEGVPYFKDVMDRVLSTSCVGCHSNAGGNRGKVNLETYQNVFAARQKIKEEVVTGFMPPKKRATPLTDEQKKIIVDWIDQGAKLDDSSVAPTEPPVAQPTEPTIPTEPAIPTEPTTTPDQTADPAKSVLFLEVMEKVIKTNCLSCHSDQGGNKHDVNLETYETMFAFRFETKQQIEDGTMPTRRGTPLTPDQKTLILRWLNEEALKSKP